MVRIYIANCLVDAASASQKDGDGRQSTVRGSMHTECSMLRARVWRCKNQRKSYEILEGRMAYELQLAGHLRYIRRTLQPQFLKWHLQLDREKGTVQFIDRIDDCVGKIGWE